MAAALMTGVTAGQSARRPESGSPMAKADGPRRSRARTPIQAEAGTPPSPVSAGTRLNRRSRGNATGPQSEKEVTPPATRDGRWRAGLRGNEEEERAEPRADGPAEGDPDPPADASVRRGEGAWPEAQGANEAEAEAEAGADRSWADSEPVFGITQPPVFDPAVNWRQTFDVEPLDFHSLRSDWIDLSCNISGNLLLDPGEASALADGLMKKLHLKNPG